MSDATDVLIAAYLTKDGATLDYDALLSSGAKIDGAVCISVTCRGTLLSSKPTAWPRAARRSRAWEW